MARSWHATVCSCITQEPAGTCKTIKALAQDPACPLKILLRSWKDLARTCNILQEHAISCKNMQYLVRFNQI
jgi:hypothetical protein